MGSGFALSGYGIGGGVGFLHNPGEFGIAMCMSLAISFYFYHALRNELPPWLKWVILLLVVFSMTGILSSLSRGAALGGISVLSWIWLKSKRKMLATVGVLIVAVTISYVLSEGYVDRFKQAGGDTTSIDRLERWERGIEMVERYPYLGVGFANWSIASMREFHGGPGLSHNIFIQCMSELGYSGLIVFILMVFYTFVNNYQTRKMANRDVERFRLYYNMAHGLDAALIGFLVSGVFVTVLYYPFFWINLAMTVSLNNIQRTEAETEHSMLWQGAKPLRLALN